MRYLKALDSDYSVDVVIQDKYSPGSQQSGICRVQDDKHCFDLEPERQGDAYLDGILRDINGCVSEATQGRVRFV